MGNNLYMGIDCGQTLTKVSVFNEEACEVCSFSEKSGVSDGMKEQNDLWNTVARLIKRVCCCVDSKSIVSVAVSGHGNGAYFVYDEPLPEEYAVLSTFTKSSSVISLLDKNSIFDIAYQMPWAGQTFPILRYIKETDNRQYQSIKKVMYCKDYINYRLTGNICTDYGDASAGGMLDCRAKAQGFNLLSLYSLEECADKLPEVKSSGSLCGTVLPQVALDTGLSADTKVYVGCFDVHACTLGAAVTEDVYSSVAGTWTICGGFSDEAVHSTDLFECTIWGDGKHYFNIESSPSCAVNLEEYRETVKNVTNDESEKIAGAYKAEDLDIIFLPFAKGIPKNGKNPAGYIGEGSDDEKLRALYEGIAMGHRYHIESLKKAGIVKSSVRLSGGLSNSEIWCRILSDVLNMPVSVSANKNCGALGAAFCMKPELIPQDTGNIYYPDSKNVCIYNNKYIEFLRHL